MVRESAISALVLTLILIIQGCQSNNFVKVDFKYRNLSHMPVDDAMVELDVSPKALIYALGDSFKAQNNLMLDRQKLDFFNMKSPNYKECWEAQKEIIAAEFVSYQQNNFSSYENLDRHAVFAKHGVTENCTLMQVASLDTAESWFLRVEIPQGNYNTTISVPNVESFFAFSGNVSVFGNSTSYSNQTVTTSFSSRLYIWAWKESPESKTKVYLMANPVNSQVEACGGCSIGYKWWKQSNGYAEFKLVKHYKFLLEDLAEKLELQQTIQENQLGSTPKNLI
jgi:hypothetical protein